MTKFVTKIVDGVTPEGTDERTEAQSSREVPQVLLSKQETPHLTHLDEEGAARMVDVGHKALTPRKARAQAIVVMEEQTLALLQAGRLPKGDALQVARLAGIMAAKKTPDLIPLCHPIPLSKVEIQIEVISPTQLCVIAEVGNTAQTGVEMEALTACTVAALTLYDMAKAVDPQMKIEQIMLLEKSGGKHGHWVRSEPGTRTE